MNAVVVVLISFAALLGAYFVYGRFLAARVFQLDGNRPTPAHTLEDGVDYVPTRVPVLFGHHFASIAGLGPILGPALAVVWGWLPAVLWVVIGCIFMGAVHDLGALTVSLRYKGRSIGDVSREIIGERARLLFLLIIFFLMSLAMGAFVVAISGLFVAFRPDAIIPSFGLMLVAVAMGIAVYKLKFGLGPVTVVALAAFAGLIYWGVEQPIPTYKMGLSAETAALLANAPEEAGPNDEPAIPAPYGATAAQNYLLATGHEDAAHEVEERAGAAKGMWIWVLLGYGFIASVLPVWLLLQPRDFINSFQLYLALALLAAGLLVASVTGSEFGYIHAEMVRTPAGDGALPLFPFLFITIACGAISGFHSLVSSGTTVRQLNRETDALPIGYGAMLTEGALAVLVILACVAGMGAEPWGPTGQYATWSGIKGGELTAVIRGGANFLAIAGETCGLDHARALVFGQAFLAVTIVAFALTTLDSATRLLRFNVEEIFRSVGLGKLAHPYIASFVAVCGIAGFAMVPGARTLWYLFGSSNQLLAGLTLLTVSLFLFKLGRPVIYTLIPMVIMLAMTTWAILAQFVQFYRERQWPLVVVISIIMAMTAWLLIEAFLAFQRGRGGLKLDEEKTPAESREMETAAES